MHGAMRAKLGSIVAQSGDELLNRPSHEIACLLHNDGRQTVV